MRVFLVVATEGTLDAFVWSALVDEVRERGLIATYRDGAYTLNHPPVAVALATAARELGLATGLAFPVVFRAPFVLVDAAIFASLVSLLGASRHERWRRARWVIAAAWWLSPLAMIFSAHHGNTDSAVALSLVAAAACVARGRPGWAGALFGLGLCIKIPGALAGPLLLLAIPDWHGRIRFVVAGTATVLAGYGPWLVQDAEAVVRSVFLYPGLRIQTTHGMPIWGLERFLPDWRSVDPAWRAEYRAVIKAWLRANTWICLVPIVALAVARRGRDEAVALAAGLAGTYTILYGLSNLWSFQYLAWSLPFWAALGWRWASVATLLTTAYVYGLYAWLCGSWLLLGEWDFIARPDWPIALRLARDACIVFFAATAIGQITGAVRAERARWQGEATVG